MNVLNMAHALDITSVAGQTLSTEETFVIQNALLILQGENHFKHIYFMGKIFGIEKDYYLAFGYQSDAIATRSFFFSNNKHEWFVLGEPTPCALKLSPKVSRRFTGNPNHIIDLRDAGDTCSVTGRECILKEEDRLAAVAFFLHEDCAIAPRGAFYQDIEGLMEISPTFQGLSLQQGTDDRCWTHTPKKKQSKPQSSGDSLNADTSLKGRWSFRVRVQGSVCVLLHLEWIGLVVYHRLRTPEHGFVYFGDGLKSPHIVK